MTHNCFKNNPYLPFIHFYVCIELKLAALTYVQTKNFFSVFEEKKNRVLLACIDIPSFISAVTQNYFLNQLRGFSFNILHLNTVCIIGVTLHQQSIIDQAMTMWNLIDYLSCILHVYSEWSNACTRLCLLPLKIRQIKSDDCTDNTHQASWCCWD